MCAEGTVDRVMRLSRWLLTLEIGSCDILAGEFAGGDGTASIVIGSIGVGGWWNIMWRVDEADSAFGGIDTKFRDDGEVSGSIEVPLDVSLESVEVWIMCIFGCIIAVDSVI